VRGGVRIPRTRGTDLSGDCRSCSLAFHHDLETRTQGVSSWYRLQRNAVLVHRVRSHWGSCVPHDAEVFALVTSSHDHCLGALSASAPLMLHFLRCLVICRLRPYTYSYVPYFSSHIGSPIICTSIKLFSCRSALIVFLPRLVHFRGLLLAITMPLRFFYIELC
jgi:hypothetical protein